MKNRKPIAVFLLGLVTLGFYSWYWAVKTKGEMNKLGESVPTAWIWLIPIIGSIWWYWKYAEAVEHVTQEKLNWVLALLVLWLLGIIGQAIVQDFFNKVQPLPATGPAPEPNYQPPTSIQPNQPVSDAMPPSITQPEAQHPVSQPPVIQQPPTQAPPTIPPTNSNPPVVGA